MIWSKEEIEFLIKNYPVHGAKLCCPELNRSIDSVKQKARFLGLKSGIAKGNNVWTKEEDSILVENYPGKGAEECLLLIPNRTIHAIKYRVAELSLKLNYNCRRWDHAKYEEELFNREIDYFPMENYIDSRTPIKHECLKDHTWKATPGSILSGSGCPYCSRSKRFDKNKPAILYYVKISTDSNIYYKIGITNKSLSQRFASDTNVIVDTLLEKQFSTGELARSEELKILNLYKKYRVTVPGLIRRGYTELFTVDILGLDKSEDDWCSKHA